MNWGTGPVADRSSDMPRYYFHLYNDVVSLDEEGVELANLEAERLVALHNVRFSAAESIKTQGHIVLDHRIDVADERGTILDTVRFRDAVQVEG